MTDVRTHAVALAAYERVEARRDDPETKKYGALAHKLPGMILENGLAQATGFLLAKGKTEHRALLEDLNAVLSASGTSTASDGQALHRMVIRSDLDQTMSLTRRSLEASGWIKRYVQGVLQVNATDEQDADDDTGSGGGT